MKRKPSLLFLSNLVFPILLFCPAMAHAIYPFPVSSTTAETAAYIVWRTDVAGSSQVNYGLTTSYGSSTILDSSLVTYHAQSITGLSANTIYHYQVVSTDAGSNSVYSQDYTFTTLAAPSGTVLTVGSGKTYSTIQACANVVSPGGTCEVYAGRYNEVVSVPNSGSSGSPIAFEAHDAALVAGFKLASKNYVNIEGFEITTTFSGSSYESCSPESDAVFLNSVGHVTIASNYIHNIYAGVFVNEPFHVTSSYLQVLNNIMAFAYMPYYTGNPARDSPCNVGSGGGDTGHAGISGWGNYNLFDGNDVQEADHFFEVTGSYNVYRRNISHDTHVVDWGSDCSLDHNDFFHPLATTGFPVIHQVIENNQDYNDSGCNDHFMLWTSVSSVSTQSLGSGDGSTRTFGGTLSLSGDTIAPFSVTVVAGSVSASDNGFGTLTGTGISSGSVNYSTGVISVTFSAAPGSGIAVNVSYDLTLAGSHDTISRFNLAYNLGEQFYNGSVGGTSGSRLYNNTIVHAGYEGGSSAPTVNAQITFSSDSPQWVVLNSIFDDAWVIADGAPWATVADGTEPQGQAPGYSLAYALIGFGCPSACGFSTNTTSAPGMILNRNPSFSNVSTYDFSLQAGSPALGAGTYLTTVASTDTGSGTSMIVNDAGFFQDGYTGIVTPDCIAVTTVSNTVCITSINYSTNTVTLAAGITRHVGDPVWLVKDSTGRTVLVGNAPNIGATFGGGAPPPPPPAPPTNLAAVPQ